MAGRARLRLHPGLRAGDGDRGAGGDRPAAAPQPGRDELGGAAAAQAGGAVHGHDAGDDRRRGCSETGRARTTARPDKDPAVRLRVLDDAGRLSIPFTTGILVGIGETLDRAGRVDPRDPPHRTGVRARPGSDRAELPGQARTPRCAAVPGRRLRRVPGRDVAVARLVLGPEMRIQAPPNLYRRDECLAAARRRHRRLGRGVAADPGPRQPGTALAAAGRAGRADRRGRFRRCASGSTAHPEYVLARRAVARPAGAPHVRALADPDTGLAAGRRPGGLPWQEPDEAYGVAGPHRPARGDRHRRPAHRRPRSDFDSASTATGSRSREQVAELGRAGRARSARRRRAGGAARRPSATRPVLQPTTRRWRCAAPTARRWKRCRARRRRCAGTPSATTSPTWSTGTSTSPTSATSAAGSARSPSASATPTRTRCRWTRSPTGPRRPGRRRHRGLHAGRHRPELPVTAYADLVRAIKARVPAMHVHAFSPMEIVTGAARPGCRIRDWLIGAAGGRPGHHPRHRRGDPRRRRALGADQGQTADVAVGRGGHHRARGWASGPARP